MPDSVPPTKISFKGSSAPGANPQLSSNPWSMIDAVAGPKNSSSRLNNVESGSLLAPWSVSETGTP